MQQNSVVIIFVLQVIPILFSIVCSNFPERTDSPFTLGKIQSAVHKY